MYPQFIFQLKLASFVAVFALLAPMLAHAEDTLASTEYKSSPEVERSWQEMQAYDYYNASLRYPECSSLGKSQEALQSLQFKRDLASSDSYESIDATTILLEQSLYLPASTPSSHALLTLQEQQRMRSCVTAVLENAFINKYVMSQH